MIRLLIVSSLFSTMNWYMGAVVSAQSSVASNSISLSQFVQCYQKSIDQFTAEGSLYEYRWLDKGAEIRLQIAFEGGMLYETYIDDNGRSNGYACVGADYYLQLYCDNDVVDSVLSCAKITPRLKTDTLNQVWQTFLGVIPGSRLNTGIKELLEKLNNVLITENTVDDSQVITCKGDVNGISLSVSLDKNRGYVTKQVSFQNSNPKIGKLILPLSVSNPEIGMLMNYVYTVTNFCEVDGLFVPQQVRGRYVVKGGKIDAPSVPGMITIDGTPKNEEYELVCTKKTASSVIAGKSVFDKMRNAIPNGTPVYMQDVPQIEYIWMDGKIEPRTDEIMLRIAQGDHKFIPGTDEPRFWIMVLGAILIIVGFSLKAVALYKQWHSDDNKMGGGEP